MKHNWWNSTSLRRERSEIVHGVVAPQPGEMITLNNSQELLLNVENSKPKILYLGDAPGNSVHS